MKKGGKKKLSPFWWNELASLNNSKLTQKIGNRRKS